MSTLPSSSRRLDPAEAAPDRLSKDTALGAILDDDRGRAVLEAHLPALVGDPLLEAARGTSPAMIAGYAGEALPAAVLAMIDREL
ncbi:hypothetical protein GCM10010517_16190 [Streptosporangium fragile]|uniref:Uncharacterized protein n=1 Tax=Streptosporangium fragile TaxID=46186 RepID=A0ABP6IBP1_9ACTN